MTLEKYEEEFFNDMEHGTSRRNGIRAAINAALETDDADGALQLYYKFMNEDIFHCDNFQATLLFPEYLAYFERHPELQDKYQHDMMWSYKWIINNFDSFYQVPLKQVESIFNQYADFCKRFHYSLRTYYEFLGLFIQDSIEPDQPFCGVTARQAHQKMMKSKRDSLSDCHACELDKEATYYLEVENDIEKALKVIQPVFDGEYSCAEVPHVTYAKFAEHYFENGDLKNAMLYTTKSYRLIDKKYGDDGGMITSKAKCALRTAYVDPKKALKMLKKTLPFIKDNNNGDECFHFFRAAYHTMLCLENKGRNHIQIKLPFKDEEIFREDGIYSVSELKAFMFDKAKFYADQFDERNGNTLFNNLLNRTYSFDDSDIEKPSELDIPVLEYIEEYIDDGCLPDSFALPRKKPKSDNKMIYGNGAQDGFEYFHTKIPQDELGELEEIIQLAGKGEVPSALKKTEKYFSNDENRRALHLINAVQNFIIDNETSLNLDEIYRFGVWLTVRTKNYEAVKLGLSILEVFSDYNEHLLEAITELAACDEFTLFCIWAVRKLDNGNELIFEMAKHTFGWGKILAVDHLEPTTDEIKEWLLYEGIKTDIHPGYLAIKCFEGADVHTLLEKGLTQEQLTPVGMIIMFLIEDGPSIGIRVFDDGDNIIKMYLNNAERLECSEIDEKVIEIIQKGYEKLKKQENETAAESD